MNSQYSNPLLATLTWPSLNDDLAWVEGLHSPQWMFFITAYVRTHILTQCPHLVRLSHPIQLKQVQVLLLDLMSLFSPISLTILYLDCLQYYQQLVDQGEIPFVFNWYANILNTTQSYVSFH